MASLVEEVYARCPPWVQSLGIAAFGVVWKRRRLGGRFREEVEGFLARDRFGPDQWRDYQTERLRALLVHVVRNVPHYRRVWGAAGLTEADLAAFGPDDLPSLPITEKDEVRRNPADFLAAGSDARRLHTYYTSGSSGTPLEVKMSTAMHQTWSAAYEVRCRRWAGVDHTMSRAMLGGRLIVPRAASRPPFWRYNPAERHLYLSAYHVAPANAPDYAAALNKYRPDYLIGYAAAHFSLARMIEEAGLSVHSPRVVLTSSEKLTDEMRETLSRVYRCPVFDGYSGVEACCLASECEHHRLHVSPDVGVLELVDDQGRPVGPGEEGQVIATGLLNFDQPLVRYRTGDLAVWSDEPCPCGRAMPVLRELVGRLDDTVVGPDGREMTCFHRVFAGLRGVREGQVVQEAIDRLTLRVVAPGGLAPETREAIVRRVHERLGEVAVEVREVESIERTERGKFRSVVSQVSRTEARPPAGRPS
jgi:phenylacetate-CoA ligase